MESLVFGLADKGDYVGSFPRFHRIEEFPQLKVLEDKWIVIRNELLASQNFRVLNAVHSLDNGGWKGMYLNNFGWRNKKNIDCFPELVAILRGIPHVVFVAFSILEPGAKLEAHWGDSNATVRGALGLEVPGEPPLCGLEVGGEMRSWSEGKLLLFSECYLHSAVNHTGRRRVVLTVDIIRPGYEKHKQAICANVLTWQTVTFLQNRFVGLGLIGRLMFRLMRYPVYVTWRVYSLVLRCSGSALF